MNVYQYDFCKDLDEGADTVSKWDVIYIAVLKKKNVSVHQQNWDTQVETDKHVDMYATSKKITQPEHANKSDWKVIELIFEHLKTVQRFDKCNALWMLPIHLRWHQFTNRHHNGTARLFIVFHEPGSNCELTNGWTRKYALFFQFSSSVTLSRLSVLFFCRRQTQIFWPRHWATSSLPSVLNVALKGALMLLPEVDTPFRTAVKQAFTHIGGIFQRGRAKRTHQDGGDV